jgi:N-acetylmuramoyl-L-alanine amidase
MLSRNPAFTVRLSRPTPDTVLGTDNSSSLVERVREANSWGADAFISIHTNSAPNPAASGSEALIYSKESAVAPELAEDILSQLNLVTGLRNRGVIERPGLYVLRRTAMPAVLVEIGFISNRYDAELMAYSPGLFAEGIYRGIVEYYGL